MSVAYDNHCSNNLNVVQAGPILILCTVVTHSKIATYCGPIHMAPQYTKIVAIVAPSMAILTLYFSTTARPPSLTDKGETFYTIVVVELQNGAVWRT